MINLAHRVWIVDAEDLRMRAEVEHMEGKLLRRITAVGVPSDHEPRIRLVHLNCGHAVRVDRGLRPTVGKLTGCPECK